MSYVDGFLLPLAKDKVDAYREQAGKAGPVWMDHGARAYHECIAEDLFPDGPMARFSDMAGAKENETVVFAYIVYDSREHRDEVNAKVMADERLKDACDESIFDFRRMAYGGFKSLVEL